MKIYQAELQSLPMEKPKQTAGNWLHAQQGLHIAESMLQSGSVYWTGHSVWYAVQLMNDKVERN